MLCAKFLALLAVPGLALRPEVLLNDKPEEELGLRKRHIPGLDSLNSFLNNIGHTIGLSTTPGEWKETLNVQLNVSVSAVRFCAALVRHITEETFVSRHDTLEEMSASDYFNIIKQVEEATANGIREELKGLGKDANKICAAALVEPWLEETWPEKVEEVEKEMDKSGEPFRRGHEKGRLENVGEGWKVAMQRVCKEECGGLVEKLSDPLVVDSMLHGVKHRPLEKECAETVVQEVEANLLGCCADSCGYNGKECTKWAFLNNTQRGEWEAECCTEFNVLEGSDREKMCDSTVSWREKDKITKDNQSNTKEDRLLVGEDFDISKSLYEHLGVLGGHISGLAKGSWNYVSSWWGGSAEPSPSHQAGSSKTALLQTHHNDLKCPPIFEVFKRKVEVAAKWLKTDLSKSGHKARHGTCKDKKESPDSCAGKAFIQGKDKDQVTCCNTENAFWTTTVWEKKIQVVDATSEASAQGWLFLHQDLNPEKAELVRNPKREANGGVDE